MGDGIVMILDEISSKGSLILKIIKGKYNTNLYFNNLREIFFLWCISEFLEKIGFGGTIT